MSRYDNLKPILTDDNCTRLPLMHSIDIDISAVYVVSNPERLSFNLIDLATKYYGDGKLWWVIAKANDVKLPFSVNLEAIIIPKNIQKILSSIR